MISVPGTTHRYLQRTPSERQVRTAASSSERISPHYRVTRPQSPCLGKAIQSQSRVHLCNAVVRVRHPRPATPALAGQSRSFSLLRPQSSPIANCWFSDQRGAEGSLNSTPFALLACSVAARSRSETGIFLAACSLMIHRLAPAMA